MNTPSSPELTLAAAKDILSAQPFSRWLGARLTEFRPGSATVELDIHDHLKQQHGQVHGGVLAYLADNALTFAGGSVLGPDVLTAGFSINFLRPADGQVLRASAVVVDTAGRQATCRCDVSVVEAATAKAAGGTGATGVADGTEVRLCALAQGTIISARRPVG